MVEITVSTPDCSGCVAKHQNRPCAKCGRSFSLVTEGFYSVNEHGHVLVCPKCLPSLICDGIVPATAAIQFAIVKDVR